MRRLAAALALVIAIAAGGDAARACCMVPRSWKGDVDQSWQRVVAVHHAGHQEMAIRVAPFFPGSGDGPPYLEWVVTVPDRPTGYAVVDAKVFEEAERLSDRLQDLADAQHAARTRFDVERLSGGKGGTAAVATAAGDLDVSAPVKVGPFEIVEVKARGPEALAELNAYLAGRGFPEEDYDHMKWFVDRGFTFLCIHVTPPEGEERLGPRVELPALRMGFATERPYYPGKFSSRQGNFGLSLTTFTSAPLATGSLDSVRERLVAPRRGDRDNLWTAKALPGLVGEVAKAASGNAGVSRWHVNRLSSAGFNPSDASGAPRIWSWKDDVTFDLGGDADGPPGWYYGDRDIGALERTLREHGIAVLLALLVVLGVVLVVLRRRRRRAPVRGNM